MHHLSIDIETYSPEPIAKTGLYKYAQHPDFKILLFPRRGATNRDRHDAAGRCA